MLTRRPVRYAEKIDRNKKRARIIINLAILVVLCAFMRSFAFQTWRVQDDAMAPSLHKGDIVLAVPYVLRLNGVPHGFAGAAGAGKVVLVSDGFESIIPARQRFVDAALRFLTFQRFSTLEHAYGDSFSVPVFMRIHSIENTTTRGKSGLTLLLASDRQESGTRATKLLLVSASRIEARAVFRIWPLASIGPVR